MASGVQLFLVLLICAGCTCENNFTQSESVLSKTELRDKHEIKSDRGKVDENLDGSSVSQEEEDGLRPALSEFQRDDKGLPSKNNGPPNFGMEIVDMLKGEPVNFDFKGSMQRLENGYTDSNLELVDPTYKLEEALEASMSRESTEDGNKESNVKYGIVANVASRIKRSAEIKSSPKLASTTEVRKQASGPKGDMESAASSHKWSKGGGKKHKKKHHKKGGHKKDKGYKTKHHHKKGEKEKHGKDEHKKHYKKHSGHKKKHHDQAEKYGEHHKKEKGHKGAKYGEKKGHKKGHKTKGYHHKFHKDEYKKEHKFYDDYHKKGHHDKHGHHHKHHAKKSGKHKKGGHHKSAYHKDQYGKKGHKEGGHYDQEHKGHKGKKGHKKYHENHSDYGKKGGHKEGKKWGYSKKHKHG